MRIVHVSPHLPPDQAANALLPAQLGRWMADRGHEVAFLAHEPVHPAPVEAGGSGSVQGARIPPLPDLPTRWIPRRDRTGSGLHRLLKLDAWHLVRAVHRALDELAADATLLHLHSNGLIVEAAAAWARKRGRPYVLTLYGTEIWHYKRRWPVDPFRRAYLDAAQVTFYSRRLLERAQVEGLTHPAMRLTYPPVSDAFAPRTDDVRAELRRALGIRERWLLVNVKRLHPLAGQRFLIDALARYCASHPDADVRLVICGEGPRREDLTRQIEALGLSSRVTLAGLVPNDMVARYVAAADLFVLPSLLEALPTVAVEALASGTPVLSADHPGGVELNGLFDSDVIVVPRESVEPLARALSEFLAHPRRTRPATARVLDQSFRPPAVVRVFEDVYDQAVRRRA